jgi:hypothetical protein
MTRDTNNKQNEVKRPEYREYVVATENDTILVGYDWIVQNLNSVALSIMLHNMYRVNQSYMELKDVQEICFEGDRILEVQWGE